MTADDLGDELQAHISKMRELIEAHMLNDGDTSETSQRMNVLNRLSQFEAAVNGINERDMKSPKPKCTCCKSGHESHRCFACNP